MAPAGSKRSTSHANGFAADAFTGLIVAVFTVVLSLSFGSLVFAGELAPHAVHGVGLALVTAALAGAIVAFRSSFPGTIAIPHDRTAPILAILAAQLVAAMGDAPADAKAAAVGAALAIAALATGAALFVVGHFRLGNLIRFIPYPVVGGFLAGAGWLLVVGSVKIMTGSAVRPSEIPRLFSPPLLAHWAPGVALGTVLYLGNRVLRRPLVLPALLMAAMAAFYAVWLGSGAGIDAARAEGWLPALPRGGRFALAFWSPADLRHLPWPAVLNAAGLVGTVLLTALISILLNTSGLELVVHDEIDINRELRAAGLANLACGLAGGLVGFQSLSLSRLGHDLGSKGRRPGLLAAGLCAAVLLVGPAPLSFVPKLVLGGLVFNAGLGFLVEWTYDASRRLPAADYAVVLLILAVVGIAGYLEGVLVGLAAAVALFIHAYSRVGIVTHALTGSDQQSNVERPVAHQRLLRDHGDEIHVLKLHGFIFFGTATGLLNDIRARARDRSRCRLQFAVLDFRRVSGLDSSATLSLARARQLAVNLGFTLVLSHLPAAIRTQLGRAGFAGDEGPGHRVFPDLDHALGWCEERLLQRHGASTPGERADLRHQLDALWPGQAWVARLLPHLERQSLGAGCHLIRQGDPADALYFVESGEVTTRLELGDGRFQRLRRHGPGTVLGELGLFLGVPRTASVVTEEPCVVYRLSDRALGRLKAEDPPAAAAFHEFLVAYLAERVVNCNKTIRALAQ